MSELLTAVRDAMQNAQGQGSLQGEHGVDLMARMWLAAAEVFEAVKPKPELPTPQVTPHPVVVPDPAASSTDTEIDDANAAEAAGSDEPDEEATEQVRP